MRTLNTKSARLSAQHPGGRLQNVAITPTAGWVSVGDTAIAFSPTTSVTAQSYTFTITATEIYSSGDEVGHGGDLTEDATGTVTVRSRAAVLYAEQSSELQQRSLPQMTKRARPYSLTVRAHRSM